MQAWQVAITRMALCTVLSLAAGCAGRQPETPWIEEPVGIERPAVPLGEEESLADRIGEVGVVLLVVGVTIGGIIVSLLAFGAL
jgi:hypothetical protein